MKSNQLLLPLLSTPRVSDGPLSFRHNLRQRSGRSSHRNILRGVLLLSIVGILSVWASHEASKGFLTIIVLRSSETESLAARRFNLMYVSNGKAERLIFHACHLVDSHLFTTYTELHRAFLTVTLRLSDQKMASPVSVEPGNEHEFVLRLNPSLLLEQQHHLDSAVASAVLRGMTRVRMLDSVRQSGDAMSSLDIEEMEKILVPKANVLMFATSYLHRLIA